MMENELSILINDIIKKYNCTNEANFREVLINKQTEVTKLVKAIDNNNCLFLKEQTFDGLYLLKTSNNQYKIYYQERGNKEYFNKLYARFENALTVLLRESGYLPNDLLIPVQDLWIFYDQDIHYISDFLSLIGTRTLCNEFHKTITGLYYTSTISVTRYINKNIPNGIVRIHKENAESFSDQEVIEIKDRLKNNGCGDIKIGKWSTISDNDFEIIEKDF